MTDYYILIDKVPTEVESLLEWGAFLKSDDKVVGRTEIDGTTVSTVFLGIDHGFGMGTPVLFETMIFGGIHNGDCERYCTWEEAERGHKKYCEIVRYENLSNINS